MTTLTGAAVNAGAGAHVGAPSSFAGTCAHVDAANATTSITGTDAHDYKVANATTSAGGTGARVSAASKLDAAILHTQARRH